MKHIIIGLVAITLGIWGIVLNWYQFVDLLWVLIPMLVLIGGIVALLAGISNFSDSPSQNRDKIIEDNIEEAKESID